jgi:hypothetical protein
MMGQDNGTLILKAVPTQKVRQDVGVYLTQIFKNAPRDRVLQLVEKAPVVLSKNIRANAARGIVAKLQNLGAIAVFVPNSQANNEPPVHSAGTDAQGPQPQEGSVEPPRKTLQQKGEGLRASRWRLSLGLGQVNKELLLILSLLVIAAVLNYMVTSHLMVLGFYMLPTLFAAYFYGRRHATLTAFASVFLVGLLSHLNPQLFSERPTTEFVEARWYELTAWAGILVVTAYAMGTLLEHNENRVRDLRQTYHGLLLMLRQFITKDKCAENHCYRVSVYAAKIAAQLGLEADKIEEVRAASLLHDIGKLETNRKLLYKAARLNQEGHKSANEQVDTEAELPEAIGGPLGRIMPIILANNDKFHDAGDSHSDGQEIPVGARVIAVADEYDSLTSDDRPQRRTIPPLHAKEVIVKLSGRDFDPGVVSAFVAAFNEGEMEIPEVVL